MSVNDYQIKNIYRYSRRTFKNARNGQEFCREEDDISDNTPVEMSTRNEERSSDYKECHCVITGGETEITRNILHKKCPVIDLAQNQLQKLLDETETFLHNNNSQGCRSLYNIVSTCKEIVCNNKYECVLAFTLIVMAFFNGVILGAASCGNHKGRLNSPILTCIENRFITNAHSDGEYSIT